MSTEPFIDVLEREILSRLTLWLVLFALVSRQGLRNWRSGARAKVLLTFFLLLGLFGWIPGLRLYDWITYHSSNGANLHIESCSVRQILGNSNRTCIVECPEEPKRESVSCPAKVVVGDIAARGVFSFSGSRGFSFTPR